jgi:hypothetical protein
MESSLSLEETNKIRISLGLKPLVDDGAPVDVKEKTAEDNYAETREREKAEQRTKFVDFLHDWTVDTPRILTSPFLIPHDSDIKARVEK